MSASKSEVTSSVGFMIALGAWSITFLTLILGYAVYRFKAGEWLYGYLDGEIVRKALMNTALIVLSSLALNFFCRVKKRVLFIAGIVLGFLFIHGQWGLWLMLLDRGLSLKSSVAGSFFYLLTGFHAVHMAVGLLVLIPLGIPVVLNRADGRQERRFGFTVRFWDLLAIFWIVLLVLIFGLK